MLDSATMRLSNNTYSLLMNYDTNLVESANSIVAEKIGGKRINYAYREDYYTRVLAAALQFNNREVTTTYYKEANKQIPKITDSFDKQNKLAHEKRKKNKENSHEKQGLKDILIRIMG